MPSRRAVLVLGGAAIITASAAVNALFYELDVSRPSPIGPVSLKDFAAAREVLAIPDDADIVPWDQVAADHDTLGDVLDRLAPDQLLGLPERPQPYPLDASDGFYANGVSAVQLADGTRQAVTSRPDRWFSLARAPRGIVGLGPGATVATTPTLWRSPAQPRPVSAGEVGRFFYDLAGVQGKELVGAAETLLESATEDAYFGNFTLVGPGDLGGIAYNGVALKKGGTAERIDGAGAWRGFSAVPNGETGMVTVKDGPYLFARMHIDGRDPETGERVGTSPVMINSSTGGTVDTVLVECCAQGMPTNWNARPGSRHRLVDFHSRWNAAHGLNLEQVGDGSRFEWTSGSLWRGRNPSHPSPDGIVTAAAHLGLDPRGSFELTIGHDVDVDERAFTVDLYGPAEYSRARSSARITLPRGIRLAM